jgi:peroxidase
MIGFPLFRQMHGVNALQINPANSYPWPLVTKGDRPTIVSAEMSVAYRFHEFIVSSFPIKDAKNRTLREQNLFETAFNARGFIETGLEGILRGLLASTIPNFKSGIDESFRSAGASNSSEYRGKPFDIATWSIVHEREQGLPTFNHYFKEYNKQSKFI